MSIKHKSVGNELTQAEYVASDSHEGLDAAPYEPTMTLDTIYQNTSGKLRLVTVAIQVNLGATSLTYANMVAECGINTPPTLVVGSYRPQQQDNGAGVIELGSITFVVPLNYYYRVRMSASYGSPTPSIISSYKWDLS